jgi:hypothetical protein
MSHPSRCSAQTIWKISRWPVTVATSAGAIRSRRSIRRPKPPYRSSIPVSNLGRSILLGRKTVSKLLGKPRSVGQLVTGSTATTIVIPMKIPFVRFVASGPMQAGTHRSMIRSLMSETGGTICPRTLTAHDSRARGNCRKCAASIAAAFRNRPN